MYLHVPDALGQPQKEPSREELQEELLLCRRDALLAERPHQECAQTLERTERVLQEAMADLAKCRTRLDAAQAVLKAAKKRARAGTRRRSSK